MNIKDIDYDSVVIHSEGDKILFRLEHEIREIPGERFNEKNEW